jgi:hypothetical protein
MSGSPCTDDATCLASRKKDDATCLASSKKKPNCNYVARTITTNLACAVAVVRAQVMSPLVKCHSTVGGGGGRKNCHSTIFTPRSGMCKDIDTFSKSCWSSVDKTKTFKFSTKIHKDAETAIQSEPIPIEILFRNGEMSLFLVGRGCPLQAGTGHGRPGRDPGIY